MNKDKHADKQTLTAEVLMDLGKIVHAELIFPLIHVFKLKYNGTFTYIMRHGHSNVHLSHS